MKRLLVILGLTALLATIIFFLSTPVPAATLSGEGGVYTYTITDCIAGGSANTYVCSTSPSFMPAVGDQVNVNFNVANTGSSTLTVNPQLGSPASTIRKWGGSTNLAAGDINANHWLRMTFDGTYWQIEGQLGNSGAASSISPTILSGFASSGSTISNSNGTGAFTVTIGTTASSGGILAMPTAAHGWQCDCNDVTTIATGTFLCKTVATTATSVQVANYNISATATQWISADIIQFSCFEY
jgi:hypothetical protein